MTYSVFIFVFDSQMIYKCVSDNHEEKYEFVKFGVIQIFLHFNSFLLRLLLLKKRKNLKNH